MIARLEELYLSVLRVSIVIVAGIALIAAIGSLLAAAYAFMPNFTPDKIPSGGTLEEFITEQKALAVDSEVSKDTVLSSDSPSAEPQSAFLTEASKLYIAYVRKMGGPKISKADAVEFISDYVSNVEFSNREAFQRSFLSLLKQLRDSTGKPLSQAKFDDLLSWHFTNFESQVAANSASSEVTGPGAWAWLTQAGTAFLLFLGIAIYFLFVRVERHLRLVKVVQTDPRINELEPTPKVSTT